jgi:hypothetical protein
MIMKNTFKVGDWVYCNYPDYREKDYIMQIESIDVDGWLKGILSTTGESNGHKYIHYRYATPEEIIAAGGTPTNVVVELNYPIY